jgi:hypothetical protein
MTTTIEIVECLERFTFAGASAMASGRCVGVREFWDEASIKSGLAQWAADRSRRPFTVLPVPA